MIAKGRDAQDDGPARQQPGGPGAPPGSAGCGSESTGSRSTGSGSAARAKGAPACWLLGLSGAAIVLLWLGGEPVRFALRYERDAVLAGQYWRLLTGHVVHGTLSHMLVNLAGLGLIAALFPRDYAVRQWLAIALASMAALAAGFVFLEPHLAWYVGLSGVLHGALAAGAVAWWHRESRLMALALTVLLAGKLAWEQAYGPLPLSGDMPVIVDAHLYGALGGLAAGLLIRTFPQARSSTGGGQDWPSQP